LVLFEQVPQFRGAAKFLDDISAQLNSVEARDAMSSIACRSFPPHVIDAYPMRISAGAGEIGVSKYDKFIGG